MRPRVDWLVSQLAIIGGAETFVRDMSLRLRSAGWPLRLIVLGRAGMLGETIRRAGVSLLELGGGPRSSFRALQRLLEAWFKERPDIVHTHLYHAGVVGRLAARLSGIPNVIVHQHGPEINRSALRSILDKSTQNLVTRYVATCQAVAQVMQERENIPLHKIEIIPNGIEIEPPHRSGKPDEWPVPKGHLGIVHAGRFAPGKGQVDLIKALSLLPPATPPVHLVMFGEGELQPKAIQAAQEYGLAQKVSFAGLRPDFRDWLPHFDLFVLPSLWEGVSFALLEAMAAGLPVIGTRAGGTPEVILENETGLLVPPGDPQDLARAIHQMAAETELRQRMGIAGRRRVESHFSAQNTQRMLEAIYNRLV